MTCDGLLRNLTDASCAFPFVFPFGKMPREPVSRVFSGAPFRKRLRDISLPSAIHHRTHHYERRNSSCVAVLTKHLSEQCRHCSDCAKILSGPTYRRRAPPSLTDAAAPTTEQFCCTGCANSLFCGLKPPHVSLTSRRLSLLGPRGEWVTKSARHIRFAFRRDHRWSTRTSGIVLPSRDRPWALLTAVAAAPPPSSHSPSCIFFRSVPCVPLSPLNSSALA